MNRGERAYMAQLGSKPSKKGIEMLTYVAVLIAVVILVGVVFVGGAFLVGFGFPFLAAVAEFGERLAERIIPPEWR